MTSRETDPHLTDESAELTGGETVVDAGEDGNGDYDVAEESSEVIEGVHADWERRGREGEAANVVRDLRCSGGGRLLTVEPELLLY